MGTRFIFVTGGVVSSIGKGITAASIGLLLKSRGYSVVNQKLDPYLNIDPGTMNPFQHGEVFVTEDGGETDLDLGHYERFTDVSLQKYNSTSAGKVYQAILERERAGGYNGATVQVVPHVTDEIKRRILKPRENNPDFIISEIGGTVGDIEAQPFIEAIRQIRFEVGKENTIFIHLGLLPFLKGCGEIKTKPMQHSVKELLSFGIQPDILICRSEVNITEGVREKLSLFSNIPVWAIIENTNADSIYEVPLMLEKNGLGQVICKFFDLPMNEPNLDEWKKMVHSYKNPKNEISIALVGKYVELHDAYLSVVEALTAASITHSAKLNISWFNSAELTSLELACERLTGFDGIIVPGGFGERGVDGMIYATQFARQNKIPFFGICLGMQVSVIEFARNVLNLTGANSTEFEKDCVYPVVDLIEDEHESKSGGTLRLGLYPCTLLKNSIAYNAYKKDKVVERHRHRYEFNNKYKAAFEKAGMVFSGINSDNSLIEIIELKEHPFFLATQFHPEFASRPNKPHALFWTFIEKALNCKG
ncbi:MAG: CTP synthase [Treponemataceae bacterium]